MEELLLSTLNVSTELHKSKGYITWAVEHWDILSTSKLEEMASNIWSRVEWSGNTACEISNKVSCLRDLIDVNTALWILVLRQPATSTFFRVAQCWVRISHIPAESSPQLFILEMLSASRPSKPLAMYFRLSGLTLSHPWMLRDFSPGNLSTTNCETALSYMSSHREYCRSVVI